MDAAGLLHVMMLLIDDDVGVTLQRLPPPAAMATTNWICSLEFQPVGWNTSMDEHDDAMDRCKDMDEEACVCEGKAL